MTPEGTGHGRGSALGRLGGVLILIGVLVGVAAIPTGAVLISAAHWSEQQRADLPAQLLNPPTAQVTRVYASDGKTLITTFYDEDRHDVTLGQIAPVMQQAIVAAEDVRYYQHGGVDLKGAVRALVADARRGAAAQGASTLTMQVVRNVLKDDPTLTPAERAAATADTPERKLKEVQYALELEQRLSKQQILQNYLNIVYFGDGGYGIEAAARRIFGVTPARLDLAQAAMIAGIVQSPDADNPLSGDRSKAKARQLYVLGAMQKAGMITAAQQRTAAAEKLTFAGTAPPNGCMDAAGTADGWGFFCDYVRTWFDAQPQFGSTVAERDTALRRGGYTIVTTLDPDLQHTAAAESRSVYGLTSKKVLPIAVVQPGTGKVLALAVNRHYSTAKGTQNTVNPLVSGGPKLYGYPSGSTFKMFTMLAALEAGMPLDTGFDAPAKLRTEWPDNGPDNCGGKYCPGNANPGWMDGYRTMWTGFGRSVNTYFVRLEEQVGPAAAVAEAKKLGIAFANPADAEMAKTGAGSWGSFTLGVVDTTPLELASAYATVAAEGTYCRPLPVQSITDAHGQSVAVTSTCKQVLDPDVARAATDAARCPVGQRGTFGECDGGTATQVNSIMGRRPVAGKTGSTEDHRTETFVGFTATAVAAGIAADPANPSDLVGSAVEADVVTAVGRVLRAAVGDGDYAGFTPPSEQIAYGG
ncbi:transglycosylase domain-containing protein [Actinoplanes sp. KI2]|uniref:transglycosylase domain-containing protein n=1 Tax=Actinoplanes sp. KI2 TaxID=2983315 RepID=UPI0021D5C556|nr:transglycosylase domain-containing protein [Actinoplanes sp. KI2]MCU7728643.1 transglycosylase domain-containing protein [Actinoplanes sp. KI2]